MMEALMAFIGAGALLAMTIFPLGTTNTSGITSRKPFTWAVWWREASVTIWALNPARIWMDVYEGFDSIGGGIIRTLGAAVYLAVVATSTALIGFGFHLMMYR